MKSLMLLIITCASLICFAQTPQDSGFTDKAEAKNMMGNGFKQGKWCEYLKAITYGKGVNKEVKEEITTHKKKATFYRLAFYKDGKPEGIMRTYNMDGTLEGEGFYINGKQNGVAKVYFPNGKIAILTPFYNGQVNGVQKVYLKNGELLMADTITKEKRKGLIMIHDTNGKLNSEIIFTKDTINGSSLCLPISMIVLHNVIILSIRDYDENDKLKSITKYDTHGSAAPVPGQR